MAKIRLNRRLIAVIHDLIMAAVSFVLALYLRLGDATFAFTSEFIVEATVLFTLVCGVVFWRVGFHRSLWRYASLDDLLALIKGVTLALLIFLPLLFLATRLELYPRSAVVINWFVLIALLGGPRFIYRMVKDRGIGLALKPASLQRIPVLLVGAGDAAELFIREMARSAATATTSSWSLRFSAAAIRGFWSGSPWAISWPPPATTIANPSRPTRIRSTMRQSSSRLTSPTSQPFGSPRLVSGSETVVIGRKSSSTVIGAMWGSLIGIRGGCKVGPPSRLVATTSPSRPNSVSSRNPSKSSTWLVRIWVCCHGSSWVSWRVSAIDRSTLT